MIIGPPFSRELLENWAAGGWCDGYPVTDIAALSSVILYEMDMREKLEGELAKQHKLVSMLSRNLRSLDKVVLE